MRVLPISDSVSKMADGGKGDHGGGSRSALILGSGGEEPHEQPEISSGKVVPLNSRRLTASHLKRVAETLELPTGATDQPIEGKLESDKHIEAANVQVVIQEEQCVKTEEVSKQESESDMEALQDALEEVNQQNSYLTDQLADTVQNLEEEKAEIARLTKELARVPTESASVLEAENGKLIEELQAAKRGIMSS